MNPRLTSSLHVGKVWPDRTDTLSVSPHAVSGTVAVACPVIPAPPGGTAVRFPRPATAAIAASTLFVAGLAGCSSDASGPGGEGDIVIGADLNNASSVDLAYARALQLRIEQINASKRLGKRRLLLRTQDNRADPSASLRNI